jgi:hypothetical protein
MKNVSRDVPRSDRRPVNRPAQAFWPDKPVFLGKFG